MDTPSIGHHGMGHTKTTRQTHVPFHRFPRLYRSGQKEAHHFG